MYSEIEQYVRQLLAESSPERTAWNIEKVRQGKPASWNYIDGCMMTALLALSEITGDPSFGDFAERLIDAFVAEDGAIRTYDPEKHTLDDINEGRVLFPLYAQTNKEKYRLAADLLARALSQQPRTSEGNFWHKQIYPNQVWLDGVYMAMPFLALYEKQFGSGDFSDLDTQLRVIEQRMKDPETGLYYHGYDASRQAFWANAQTGCSQCFWLRAEGWFSVALADLAEILPERDARQTVCRIFASLMNSLLPFADEQTGMFWQVIDQGTRDGNYLESSGSSMIAYAMLKGARLGILPASFAAQGEKTFHGIQQTCLSFSEGKMNLDHICLVAGLGPESDRRRDGTFAYYISEPVVKNDAKGVAPFLLCYTEVLRRSRG